ncbi:hypothetical protein OCT50_08155 [Leclercia adecarboxylata]|uniref:hypothetical protein n=1 Tax=Leclercia adecarboxylata TaxID=83655 RepID=UPI0025B26E43|nr:hypothetical protein [Leclercia adecarboxylata]WJT04733.1 hypothetical protein OCT50_08155 [Leclercia adecarboxylata]
MIKMIGLGLLFASITALSSAAKAVIEDAEKARHEIVLSGYQCDQVNSIKTETSWFSSERTSNVTCDKAYHFVIRYVGDVRVSVDVDSM